MANNKKEKDTVKKKRNWFKTIFLTLLILFLVGVLSTMALVFSVLKDAPEIDPSEINSSLNQTSFIYDSEGNLIEKIEAAEFRTFVGIDKVPDNLVNAFISIEDERFYEHPGIDPRGIASSMLENIKAGGIVRGASTITQQLARNVYLSSERKLSRKITEAYLALKIEKDLSKDQIMEAYLNRNFFGNNAYGVQEAAQTYFAKNVEELSLAESALIAGVVKGSNDYQPYVRIRPGDFDPNIHYKVGETDILGEPYVLVYNEHSENRQKLVLSKMKELGYITEAEYNIALEENIKEALQPGSKKISGITSYFSDFVKSETVEILQNQLGLGRDEAEEMLFTGGLKIYTTIDVSLQKELEDVYNNFAQVLLGNTDYYNAPLLIDWKLNGAGNIIDDNGQTIYYKQYSLLDENNNLFIDEGTYYFNDSGDLVINNNKLNPYTEHIDIADYYRIDDRKNLVTHTVGSLSISNEDFQVSENGDIIISKNYLDKTEGFYSINDNNHLIISNNFFYRSTQGAVQPQSASVVMDYRKGHIKAVVGGRELDGTRILNRATNSPRQPGSVIKPLSVYLPALDNGYTAASVIDDVPMSYNGKIWPQNWYKGFRGLQTLRTSVEQSINTASVKTLLDIGLDTSIEYLSRMGIVNKSNPSGDNFVSKAENPSANDENPSALALGGMSNGMTPLEVTAAYGAIANNGVYIEPTPIIKILDKDGDLLIDHKPKENVVVSPQVAYIMTDILNTTVTKGLAGSAQISNMAVAGKTGTTEHSADIWFAGYTPHYVSAVWIGNDSPAIRINRTSSAAAQLWSNIMSRAHRDLEPVYNFPRPEGIVSSSVCTQSGMLPSNICSGDSRGVVKNEIFVSGTAPSKSCDVHISAQIDSTTGLLANAYCPSGSIVNGVFIKRPIPYNPANFNGIVPDDYKFMMPGPCNVHSIDSPGVNLNDENEDKDEDEEANEIDEEDIDPIDPGEDNKPSKPNKPEENGNDESNNENNENNNDLEP